MLLGGLRAVVLSALALMVFFVAASTAHATTVTTTSDSGAIARELIGGAGSIGNGVEIKTARMARADGTGIPAAAAYGLFAGAPARLGFTSGVALTTGDVRSVLHAGDTGSTNVRWDVDNGYSSSPPGDWFAANNGAFPRPAGYPAPDNNLAHDPTMLQLTLIPDGGYLEIDWIFASEEFELSPTDPSNQAANDFALILVDSAYTPPAGQPANPADKNCAVIADAGTNYPASVFNIDQSAAYFRSDTVRDLTDLWGSTTRQQCRVRVVPGETVTMRMLVFDVADGFTGSTGDPRVDSALLLGANSLRSDTAPVAALGASPDAGTAPLQTSLSTAGSTDDLGIASWSIDFADGQSQAGSGAPPATFAHTYQTAGTFNPRLTVTDGYGQQTSATRAISVAASTAGTGTGTGTGTGSPAPSAGTSPPAPGAEPVPTPAAETATGAGPSTGAAAASPTLTVRARPTITLKKARAGIPLTVACTATCSLIAKALPDARSAKRAKLKGVIGSGRATLAAGASRLIKVKLSAKALSRLARLKRLKKVTLIIHLASGTTKLERRITLKL